MNDADREPSHDKLKSMADADRIIHSPARLAILAHLSVAEEADFTFLMNAIGLTQGNLSSHMSRLEKAGYITVKKEFVGRRPLTLLRLTREGRAAFRAYRRNLKRFLESLPED
jgi:DNA-binding MarR family transcriptional regulator